MEKCQFSRIRRHLNTNLLRPLHHFHLGCPDSTQDISQQAMLTLIPFSTTRHHIMILALVLSLCAYSNSIRDHKGLYCEAILLPSKAPWNHLLRHGDQPSFLLMTGLTRDVFIMLHNILKPPGHPLLPKCKGRKWSLTSGGSWDCFCFTSVAP